MVFWLSCAISRSSLRSSKRIDRAQDIEETTGYSNAVEPEYRPSSQTKNTSGHAGGVLFLGLRRILLGILLHLAMHCLFHIHAERVCHTQDVDQNIRHFIPDLFALLFYLCSHVPLFYPLKIFEEF